jgi:PhnB protein
MPTSMEALALFARWWEVEVMSIRHVRHGFGAVRPYVHGPVALLDFVKETFGATELERHEFGPDSYHVELRIGDSVLVIEAGDLPGDVPAWTNSIYVYVDDVDAVFAQALTLGATSIAEITDKPYDERQGGFRDMAGNVWWVSTFKE